MSDNFHGELVSASTIFESGYAAAAEDWGSLFDGFQEMPSPAAPPVEKVAPQVEKTAVAAVEAPATAGFNDSFCARAEALKANFDSLIAKASTPIRGADHTPRLTRMANGDELTEAGRMLFG